MKYRKAQEGGSSWTVAGYVLTFVAIVVLIAGFTGFFSRGWLAFGCGGIKTAAGKDFQTYCTPSCPMGSTVTGWEQAVFPCPKGQKCCKGTPPEMAAAPTTASPQSKEGSIDVWMGTERTNPEEYRRDNPKRISTDGFIVSVQGFEGIEKCNIQVGCMPVGKNYNEREKGRTLYKEIKSDIGDCKNNKFMITIEKETIKPNSRCGIGVIGYSADGTKVKQEDRFFYVEKAAETPPAPAVA